MPPKTARIGSDKIQVTLSREDRRLLQELARRSGLPYAAVLRLGLRSLRDDLDAQAERKRAVGQ